MIAAKEHWKFARSERMRRRITYRKIPREHFGQMPIARARRLPRIGWSGQVAVIAYVQSARSERMGKTRDPQGFGPH